MENHKTVPYNYISILYTIYMYNIIKLKFVCLNALISGTAGSNSETLFALDSPFIEKCYRLYNITLRPIRAEQRVKPRGTASHKYKALCI